eukprot:TRINITY_DN2182_c0_g1_i3.p1 TRINITY_DN2182_c0_g1~~TRINITY_DN2182_c0_g1_i3.p1  ORF type:complete len:747 (-),score=180.70 TRINITY_DN2182_c0_g1_i3:32-2041(-)
MAASLYTRLQADVDEHIRTSELPRLLGQTSDPTLYLSLVNTVWQEHCEHMIMIRSIFLYLDRTYLMQTQGLRSLWDMGLTLFRAHITTNEEVVRKTLTGLLRTIERERNGETVNRGLMKSLLRMFTALGQYNEAFERPFLEASNAYYKEEGCRKIQEIDVADYLKHVEGRLAEEADRVIQYLDVNTKKPIIMVVERQLLETHVADILAKGFSVLMNETRVDDLGRMYQLLARVSSLEKLRASFKDYIKATGVDIVTHPEKDATMVQDLLDFKARADSILDQSFHHNEAFAYGLKEAFEQAINSRQNRPAELVAKYIDARLKSGGSKGMSEEETESLFDRLMVLFRYIQGKDVFEAFYKKDLAKRLLLGKSSSIDTEKSMITRIKAECGSSFTSKLEGMFKDVALSKDLMDAFAAWQEVQAGKGAMITRPTIDINVSVLTTGFWPPYAPVEVKLPKEFIEVQDLFKSFYMSKYSGRRLQWQNSLGHCVLKANFPAGRKEIIVSLFQTAILMLFNDGKQVEYQEIAELTGIETKELRNTLASLTLGKAKVLNKEPKTKDIGDEDVFTFNSKFSAKLFRIKINSVQMKETAEEQTKTQEKVFEDRQYQVDAAIVRIMKMRKTLTHNLLMSEIIGQIKFQAKPADLKKRIESLIEREYLERDPNNPQLYTYLA